MKNQYLELAKTLPVKQTLLVFDADVLRDADALRIIGHLHARLPFEHPGRYVLERAGLSIARQMFVNAIRVEAALHVSESGVPCSQK